MFSMTIPSSYLYSQSLIFPQLHGKPWGIWDKMSFIMDENKFAGCLDGAGNMPTFNGMSNCSDDFMKRLRESHFILHSIFPSPGTLLSHLIWGSALLCLVILCCGLF